MTTKKVVKPATPVAELPPVVKPETDASPSFETLYDEFRDWFKTFCAGVKANHAIASSLRTVESQLTGSKRAHGDPRKLPRIVIEADGESEAAIDCQHGNPEQIKLVLTACNEASVSCVKEAIAEMSTRLQALSALIAKAEENNG